MAKSRDRSSDLSFQCKGELFADESSWLGSPLNPWDRPKSKSLPYIYAHTTSVDREELEIESWLSDSSSCVSEDDILVSIQDSDAQIDVLTSVGLCDCSCTSKGARD